MVLSSLLETSNRSLCSLFCPQNLSKYMREGVNRLLAEHLFVNGFWQAFQRVSRWSYHSELERSTEALQRQCGGLLRPQAAAGRQKRPCLVAEHATEIS